MKVVGSIPGTATAIANNNLFGVPAHGKAEQENFAAFGKTT